jgi:DivIVA domain-containing protein
VIGLSEAAADTTLDVVAADGIDPVGHDRTLSRGADRSGSSAMALWITSGDVASVPMSDGLTADDVRNATFEKPPWGKRGYDEKSVNDFLALAARRLDGRGHLSADDVRGVRFGKPKIGKRGYDTEQVDAMLDRIAAAIADLDA